MKVVVGLGNPGSEYAHTRHNLGYRVVDLLAERLKGTWSVSAWYFFCRIANGSGALLLVKPVTFMNRSGVAVADVQDRMDVDIGDVLVVVDPADYDRVVEAIDGAAGPDRRLRFELARKAFAHTAAYDATIAAEGSSAILFYLLHHVVRAFRHGWQYRRQPPRKSSGGA